MAVIPQGAQQNIGTDALVVQESSAWDVPVWLTRPLVSVESGGDPNAANAGHYGLLQIGPSFPGAAGKNLLDPKTNLDVGLAQIHAYLQSHPSDMQNSLQSFQDVISHTGWDTTLGWAHEGEGEPGTTQQAVQQKYNRAYQEYSAPSATLQGPPNPITAVGNALSFATNPVGWIQQGGWHLLIVVIALVVLIASAMKIIGVNPSDIAQAVPK